MLLVQLALTESSCMARESLIRFIDHTSSLSHPPHFDPSLPTQWHRKLTSNVVMTHTSAFSYHRVWAKCEQNASSVACINRNESLIRFIDHTPSLSHPPQGRRKMFCSTGADIGQ